MIAIALAATALLAARAATPAPPAAPAASAAPADPDTLLVGGGTIEITFDGDGAGVTDDEIRTYVRRAADAVTLYYGRFPVKHVYVDVTKGGPLHVGHGVTFMGRRIRISIGAAARNEELLGDWRMTHEMFHLGFPDLDDDYLWMEEGLSTYLEPIARVRAGQLEEAPMWADMMDGMPQGLPAKGDEGLDKTHTWGRTYWGGCLFWLLADIEIRERTKNAKSLDDAMRAILAAGGNGSAHWSVAEVIAKGDAATGTTVLADLHKKYGLSGTSVDLPALWKKLGLERTALGVTFHADAPDAALRAAIAAKRKP